MSCNTGSTCFSGGIVIGPSNPTNCGVDPCLAPRTITDLVFYNGPALSCSSIKTCDTLTVAIQKLDDKICTTISPITASNGLYLNVNDVRMGGELIEVTTIITDSIYTLAIQGLIPEPDPDYLVSQTLGGILQKTNTSSFISGILSQITANNGLTKTGNNIQLGGPLVKDTSIDLAGYDLTIDDSTSVKVSTIFLGANKLDSNLKHMSLGFNNPVTQDYSMAIGSGNDITGTGSYAFAAGVGNVLKGTSIFALGESNTVNTNCAGALGCLIDNQGYLSYGIGYDLQIPHSGIHQIGIFNDVNAIDYTDYFGSSKYPSFSIGVGQQAGISPARKMNAFHVFANGFVKSKNGHDSRGGTRGVLPPQWSDLGWERYAPAGGDFIAGHKYIINAYTSGDDFSNILVGGKLLWGQMNNEGCIFIAGVSGSATTWTTSTIIEVGRPTSPELGEMGFNLDSNCMEYWNGLDWCQLCCTTTTTTTIIL